MFKDVSNTLQNLTSIESRVLGIARVLLSPPLLSKGVNAGTKMLGKGGAKITKACFRFKYWIGDLLDSVYTGPDPFRTCAKLVKIGLKFTRIGSAIWYKMSPLLKVIPYGIVPFQFRTGPV